MTHPPGQPGGGGGNTGNESGPGRITMRLVDLLLDAFVLVFKAIPRGARR